MFSSYATGVVKKFLNVLTWSLLAFFLVPSGLILASWNAVPGDSLYGVKVGLEKTLVSITPSLALQSSLQVNYTERRLAETQQLLADTYRPQETIQSLNNLESQAVQAQRAIESVSDPTQKTLLAEQYIDTLDRISSKLEQSKQNLASAPVQQQTQIAPTQQPAITTQPLVTQPTVAQPTTAPQSPIAPQPTIAPQTPPTLRPIQASPKVTPIPSTSSTAPISQPETVVTQIQVTQGAINTAIANMHQVKQEAEKESRDQEKQRDEIKKSGEMRSEEKKFEKEKQPDKQSDTETKNNGTSSNQ